MHKTTYAEWFNLQQQQNQDIYLIIDTLATPNPLKQLFKANLTNTNYFICLYKDTEFAQLEEASPWLIPINDSLSQAIQPLLDNPENNWGYLISVDPQYSLTELIHHWRDRIEVEETPRSLYRFQDNRIIIRHLSQLNEQQIPLLLGPINSVIAWNDEQKVWHIFNNPQPQLHPHPKERPWLEIPEPSQLTQEIRQKNTMRWLLSNYTETAYKADVDPIWDWVENSLAQTDNWKWNTIQQRHYILQRLDNDQRDDSRWQPLPNETPKQHFERCKSLFNKSFDYENLAIDTSML